MKAIELISRTDKNGHLRIDYKLNKSEKKVRILILFEEEQNESDDEKNWLSAISINPAFDFLEDPAEDIYSINDGDPFND